ncbi:peptidoglycan DD-metalloendopeptidase family protein [Chamaesiphon sp. VAR_69_metabat_338]|uniref:peptidoglycan DD-metalloendopeptidase family protein n=1 Tax=Chamaesiphon sp. VAR_69_metabat_338 TaxID=2964704 RepID=UPI00286E971B|nr:peptidoglycan DD-metalloendopeptidase family protein [Chamaesiphon sp. VAR_69_metabat_338]
MSSKAEKTLNYSQQHPRLSIFFRNPLLLKIVAWLGSLSFIGASGIVWADLKPISTAQTIPSERVATPTIAAAGTDTDAQTSSRDIYGPYLPTAQKQSPVRVTPEQLPNREVPIAVAPGSASILPTGTIVRPQHADVLTADNYTVGVNGANSVPTATEPFITIPVPAPLRSTIPPQNRETVSMTGSQVQPSVRPQPTTGYRSVPEVVKLPAMTTSLPTTVNSNSRTGIPITAVKPTVVTQMRPTVIGRTGNPQPALTAPLTTAVVPVHTQDALEILVPSPRTQKYQVPQVAQLPRVAGVSVVPVVPAIPTVNTGTAKPLAFASTKPNESNTQLIYPLTSPAPTTSSFGWRTHPISGSRRFHSGVDIGAPMGAPVVAAGSGIIISSGWLGGYGKAVVIQHNGVQQTLYGHLSEVFVQPGQRIEQGTVIGRVGSTGNSTGPHLHFEARISTTDGWVAIDPGEDIKYALDNLRRSMPFAQGELPPGIN